MVPSRMRSVTARSCLVLALVLSGLGPSVVSGQTWGMRLDTRASELELRSPEAPIRGRAARWLGRYGRPESAIPALSDALEIERSPEVQSEIILALGRIGSDAAVPSLVALLAREGEGAAPL